MNEREVATIYIGEMSGLLPVLRAQLNTLSARVSEAQRAAALDELSRLAQAVADLSADFRAEDCSVLAAALGRALPGYTEAIMGADIAATAADTLTYLQGRIERMNASGRILAPSLRDRAACDRLLLALSTEAAQAQQAQISGPFASAEWSGAPAAGPATSDPPVWIPWSGPLDTFGGAQGPFAPPEDRYEVIETPIEPWVPDERSSGAYDAYRMGGSDPSLGPSQPSGLPAEMPPVASALSDEDLATVRAFSAGTLRPATPPSAPSLPAVPTVAGAHLPAVLPGAEVGGVDLDAIPPEVHALFEAETGQDVQELKRLLMNFELQPERAQIQSMILIAHKIKGAASTLRFEVLSALAHAYVDHLGLLQSGRVPVDEATLAILQQGLAELDRALAPIALEQQEDPESVTRMHALTATLLAHAADAAQQRPQTPAVGTRLAFASGQEGEDEARAPDGGDNPQSSSPSLRAPRPGGEPYLHVDAGRMDALMAQVSALTANRVEMAHAHKQAAEARADMEHAVSRLDELSVRLADNQPGEQVPPASTATPPAASAERSVVLGEAASQDTGAPVGHSAAGTPDGVRGDEPALARDTPYDQAQRSLEEAMGDVRASASALGMVLRRLEGLEQAQETLAATIEQAITQVRLVPLSSQVPLLQRAIHLLALQLGKRVLFTVSGEMTGIEREVSDSLGEALTQLVRNAVAHGIETPEERVALGKSPDGSIWLHAYHTGNEVNIEVSDDGQGINPDRVIASAWLDGLIDAEEARQLSPEAALSLIFEPGMTTFAEPTAAAGHGVGLAGVAETLRRLHGTIEVRSMPGQGTTFHIRVSISLSVVRALRVTAAEQDYAIPLAMVLRTLPMTPAIEAALARPAGPAGAGRRAQITVDEATHELSVYVLVELLGRPYLPGAHALAMLVELGRQQAALIVDGLKDEGELVVRSLPAHLQRRGVRGAALSPAGEVLLLLDLPELVARTLYLGQSGPRLRPALPRLVPTPRPRVLVVDDSLTIRRALETTFDRAGYVVRLARDGMEALAMMMEELPEVVILDVEMPRLDGFELLAEIRKHEAFGRVKVVMLTTRAAEQHRQHAEALGADAYLVKPCPEEELLGKVREVLARS